MFIVYNVTTGRVHTASETEEPFVPEGHQLETIAGGFADAPANPSLCKFEDGVLIFDPSIEAEFAPTYAQQRAIEYPPIGDQLDALWKGGEAATQMLAQVQAIKAKYPKPL